MLAGTMSVLLSAIIILLVDNICLSYEVLCEFNTELKQGLNNLENVLYITPLPASSTVLTLHF